MTRFLFPKPDPSKGYSYLLLALRIFLGILLMRHGFDKLIHYTELSPAFPTPAWMGSEIGLLFAISAEFFCAFLVIIGALFRLSMIPVLIVMGTAFFYVHGGSVDQGELAFIYLVILILMYITGPGKYSVDYNIYKHLHKNDDE